MSKKLKVLSLCDGVATAYEALKRIGWKESEIEYHAIEIEKYKRVISDANHRGIKRPSNDVREFADQIEFDYYDAIFCGFTCTSLSSQGKRDEWDGESKIFYDCLKIVDGCKKVNPNLHFFFENVHSMSNACRDEISEKLGTEHFLGNAGLVSVQERVRYYWFNWEDPKIEAKFIDPVSVLDEDGLVIVAFSKSNRNKKGEKPVVQGRIKLNGKAATLVTGKNCKGQSTMNVVFTKKMTTRFLTATECVRLQGLENYTWPCTETQIFEAIGHGWCTPMIEEIFKQSPLAKPTKRGN